MKWGRVEVAQDWWDRNVKKSYREDRCIGPAWGSDVLRAKGSSGSGEPALGVRYSSLIRMV